MGDIQVHSDGIGDFPWGEGGESQRGEQFQEAGFRTRIQALVSKVHGCLAQRSLLFPEIPQRAKLEVLGIQETQAA